MPAIEASTPSMFIFTTLSPCKLWSMPQSMSDQHASPFSRRRLLAIHLLDALLQHLHGFFVRHDGTFMQVGCTMQISTLFHTYVTCI